MSGWVSHKINRTLPAMQGLLRRQMSTTSDAILNLEEIAPTSSLHGSELFSLSYFQASLFAAVLEDTITAIRIVQCNTELRLVKTNLDMAQLRALKYSVEQPARKDELDGVSPKDLNRNEYKVNKLEADRDNLQNVLIALYLNLSLNRSFSSLVSEVQLSVQRTNYYNFLLEDECKNRLHRRDLSRQVRQRRNHSKSVYYDTDAIIENLKTQVEDAALNAAVRSRYVESWQRARSEQNDERIRCKETAPMESIELYKQKSEQEQRVHNEVELLTTIAIEETLQKVEGWMNKFDRDMEAVDLRIQIMKNKHIAAMEHRQELEETIEKHAELIKMWVDFKDNREKARLYREKMTHAAIVVQAWWRGLLVRNQLGPYKPPPKKKGGGKGKKK